MARHSWPYLGGSYPHNQPFRWTTTSVTVGGDELLTRQDPIADRASDTPLTSTTHGGVIEAYDVLLDGLEQTFVIPTAPAEGRPGGARQGRDRADREPRSTDRHTAIQFVDHKRRPDPDVRRRHRRRRGGGVGHR